MPLGKKIRIYYDPRGKVIKTANPAYTPNTYTAADKE